MGLVHTGWIGALVVLGAFGLTVLSGRLDRANPISQPGVGKKAAYVGGH
jgi:DHA1 family inner membrane transport protein